MIHARFWNQIVADLYTKKMRLEGARNQEAPSKLTRITRYHWLTAWLTQVLEDIVIWD